MKITLNPNFDFNGAGVPYCSTHGKPVDVQFLKSGKIKIGFKCNFGMVVYSEPVDRSWVILERGESKCD